MDYRSKKAVYEKIIINRRILFFYIYIFKYMKLFDKNKAFNNLVESIGPENVGKVAAEMRANPRLAPADLAPVVRQDVQKLFTLEGDKAKRYLAESVQGRLSSAKSEMDSAFDTAMGRTVDPFTKMEQLKNNIKTG